MYLVILLKDTVYVSYGYTLQTLSANFAQKFPVLRKVKKYFYNTNTHKFEKLIISWRTKLLRIAGLVSATLVTAIIIIAIAFRFLDSPKERLMRGDIANLTEQYEHLQGRVNELNKEMADLEHRDNDVYRAVFEAPPLPDSIRYGKKYSAVTPYALRIMSTDDMLASINEGLSTLDKRIHTQRTSYDTLDRLVHSKEEMLHSIPAIQPISNKDLSHLASGFGYRIDPIYKTPKMHTGLDFAAAIGTPIYATGNGTVTDASYDESGYGNHVIINHGYGYETLYGHMVKIKVHVGSKVKRGEVIGWVGSTGKSTGPHCHYEVIRNDVKIDPIHYFFNDLSATDYERIVKIAAAGNQSFD